MSLPEPASARARWRVVIVDDSPDDRAIVRQLLLQGSPRLYEFVEAATVQAVRATPEGLSVCMILDYKLPDSDAPEVLAALFGPGEIGVCPVVVITGYDSAETGRAAIRAGAQDFVGKAWMTAESLTRATENAMERWTMARELWATEARLQLALAASNTGIWTWDLTTDRVTWSAECHGIYGVPEGSFDGTHAGFLGLVHPHDRASVRSAAQTAIEGGDHYRLEFRVIRPDGEVRWVRSQGRAEYGADGRPERMHGTVTDISERKRAELALEARERELQSLADNSPDIIARFDRELRHVFINAAVERATGRARPSSSGKPTASWGCRRPSATSGTPPSGRCSRRDGPARSRSTSRPPRERTTTRAGSWPSGGRTARSSASSPLPTT